MEVAETKQRELAVEEERCDHPNIHQLVCIEAARRPQNLVAVPEALWQQSWDAPFLFRSALAVLRRCACFGPGRLCELADEHTELPLSEQNYVPPLRAMAEARNT